MAKSQVQEETLNVLCHSLAGHLQLRWVSTVGSDAFRDLPHMASSNSQGTRNNSGCRVAKILLSVIPVTGGLATLPQGRQVKIQCTQGISDGFFLS